VPDPSAAPAVAPVAPVVPLGAVVVPVVALGSVVVPAELPGVVPALGAVEPVELVVVVEPAEEGVVDVVPEGPVGPVVPVVPELVELGVVEEPLEPLVSAVPVGVAVGVAVAEGSTVASVCACVRPAGVFFFLGAEGSAFAAEADVVAPSVCFDCVALLVTALCRCLRARCSTTVSVAFVSGAEATWLGSAPIGWTAAAAGGVEW